MQISTHASRRSWLIDMIGLTLIFGIFYTFFLGHYALFTPDEGRYSEVAREMIATGDFITPRVNGVAFLDKPILYYWLQAIAISLFGIKEWALRLFPALLGVLGCLTTYLCGRQLFDRRTGLLSAIILASTPLYFGGAHYANLDLEVAVWISCSLFFLITGITLTKPSRIYFLLAAYCCAAAAFLTKGLIGLAFPVMILSSWIVITRQWAILKKICLIRGLLLFSALVLPWYLLIQKTIPSFFHYFFITQQVTRFLSAGEFNNKTTLWFYFPIIIAGFFPWTIFLLQMFYKNIQSYYQDRKHHRVILFLMIWVAVVLLFFSIPHSKIVGYILPVFPALALLVGKYLADSWTTVTRKQAWIAIGQFYFLSFLLATILFLQAHFDWLDIAANIDPYVMASAIIFIVSGIMLLAVNRLIIQQRRWQPLFVIALLCSTAFLSTIMLSADRLNTNSVKPLAVELKSIIQPQDEVITYLKYYQDLPLYLSRRVTIVANWSSPGIINKDNWTRELWYGMTFEKTSSWLIDENTFWQRYESNNRVFVFLNIDSFEAFKAHAKHYYFIGKYNGTILLSNRPTVIAKNKAQEWALLANN